MFQVFQSSVTENIVSVPCGSFSVFHCMFYYWLFSSSVTVPTLLHHSLLTIFSHQDGVTIGLEVLLPKEAKLHADMSTPLQYDVFLYKVANNEEFASPIKVPHTHNTNSYSSCHPVTKSPKTPKASKSPKHTMDQPLGYREPLAGRHSSPGRHPSPGHYPSASRHSAPGFSSPPTCHPSCNHSPSQYKFTSASSTTPPQLRRPRGRSQASASERPASGIEYQRGHIHPSPSSPHLTQPPLSPSRVKCSPVSTHSLPPLSWPGLHPTTPAQYESTQSFVII